jgi:hypothetical protein
MFDGTNAANGQTVKKDYPGTISELRLFQLPNHLDILP